jgi:hypothetical protein
MLLIAFDSGPHFFYTCMGVRIWRPHQNRMEPADAAQDLDRTETTDGRLDTGEHTCDSNCISISHAGSIISQGVQRLFGVSDVSNIQVKGAD